MKKVSSERGYTFIELLIVVAIMSIVLGFSAVISMSSIARSSVTQERDLFVSLLLSGARAHAMANVDEDSHGIYIDNTNKKYILFTGDTYSSGNPTNASTPFTNDILSITSTGGSTVIFEALSGNVSQGAGTITIAGNDATQTILISSIGQIDW